jgi:GcrA cell cycle regulator
MPRGVPKKKKFLWTTQAINRLRELAATGITSYEIAARLGAPRPAIMGKAFREGIPLLARKNFGVSPGSAMPKPNALLPLEERKGAPRAVVALTFNQCGWPVGDPREADFHFCSKPRPPHASPPYCQEHQQIANPAVVERRRHHAH